MCKCKLHVVGAGGGAVRWPMSAVGFVSLLAIPKHCRTPQDAEYFGGKISPMSRSIMLARICVLCSTHSYNVASSRFADSI